MKLIWTLVLALVSSGAVALDLGDLAKKAQENKDNPVAQAAGAVAGDKAGEMLTSQLKNVQNEKGPIVFKSGGAAIDDKKCENTLKSIDGIIKQFPGFLVQVEGHTDTKGNAKANLKLSQKRAEAVIAWLTSHLQTPKDRMVAKGFGGTKPIADNKTEAGRAKNRRVDFSVTKQ